MEHGQGERKEIDTYLWSRPLPVAPRINHLWVVLLKLLPADQLAEEKVVWLEKIMFIRLGWKILSPRSPRLERHILR